MTRPHALRAALAATLLVLAATAGAQAPAARSGRDLRIARTVGEFQLTGTQRLDSAAGGGVLLRYVRADTLRADVFVYPGPDFATKCPEACAQRLLANEGDGFVQSLPLMVERKFMDSATVRTDSLLPPTATGGWRLARQISLDEYRHGAPVWSEFFLFYIDGARIKVRATYPREAARADGIASLARAIVAALTAPEAPGTPPDGGR